MVRSVVRGGVGRGGGSQGYGGVPDVVGGPTVLDMLDMAMLMQWRSYINNTITAWEQGAWNNGQLTIIVNHIVPAIREHLDAAKSEWPWSGDPDDLLTGIYGCYDPDVIDRAFSDTINLMYDHLVPIWQEADDLMMRHADIAPGAGPHSTNPPWTG